MGSISVISGETAFPLPAGPGFFCFFTWTAAAFSIAGAAAGTADALYAAFLRPVQIPAGQCENDCGHSENDEIFHSITSFRSVRIRR